MIFSLADELETLESLHLWRAVKVHPDWLEFIYASMYRVSIPCVKFKPVVHELDIRRLDHVTTKFKGWIEKLNVDATGQLVHRGEPMFEIYSPELYSAEAEYLLALNSGSTNDPGVLALRETAASKLKFFDVPDAQIAELEKSRTARKTLPVSAPMSGFVIEKNVVAGQMVDAGMKLYRLADLGIVWVIAQVYEQDLPFVKLGQEAIVKVSSQLHTVRLIAFVCADV